MFCQEADWDLLWGPEPIPPAADPEPAGLPLGEGPAGADRAGGHPGGLPARTGHQPGQGRAGQ